MVTATVVVQMEIKVNDTWGDNCTVGQVKGQALINVNQMLKSTIGNIKSINMISEPKCISLHYTEG